MLTKVREYILLACIPIAKQRLGKHASTMERLYFTGSAPRPFLCNGAVNTPQTIRVNRRRCFPWGPCKTVTNKNSIEQHSRLESSFKRTVCWDMSLKLNHVENSELAASEYLQERN
jgi:hypothetical protein